MLPTSDEQVIHDFENNILRDGAFHHADHVRLAFAYLRRFPVLQALDKFICALRNFAAARGKPQLYHDTITCAYFFLIRERMVRHQSRGWEDFASLNPDLLIWKGGILSRYYCEATLHSDIAREVFLLPDRLQ